MVTMQTSFIVFSCLIIGVTFLVKLGDWQQEKRNRTNKSKA